MWYSNQSRCKPFSVKLNSSEPRNSFNCHGDIREFRILIFHMISTFTLGRASCKFPIEKLTMSTTLCVFAHRRPALQHVFASIHVPFEYWAYSPTKTTIKLSNLQMLNIWYHATLSTKLMEEVWLKSKFGPRILHTMRWAACRITHFLWIISTNVWVLAVMLINDMGQMLACRKLFFSHIHIHAASKIFSATNYWLPTGWLARITFKNWQLDMADTQPTATTISRLRKKTK